MTSIDPPRVGGKKNEIKALKVEAGRKKRKTKKDSLEGQLDHFQSVIPVGNDQTEDGHS